MAKAFGGCVLVLVVPLFPASVAIVIVLVAIVRDLARVVRYR